MMILAIESAAKTASAAILRDGVLSAEFTLNQGLTHSETLLPMIESICTIGGIDLDETDAVAVSQGPGSFTGLRIGASLAKGLAMAYDIPIICVPTLRAVGIPLSFLSDAIVCPLMDARRSQVYAAAFLRGEIIVPEGAYDISEFLGLLPAAELLFAGDGAWRYRETILREAGSMLTFAGPEFMGQRAAQVASLGADLYSSWLGKHGLSAMEVREKGALMIDCFDGTVMLSDDFVPIYMRKPQAERSLEMGLIGDMGRHSLEKIGRV